MYKTDCSLCIKDYAVRHMGITEAQIMQIDVEHSRIKVGGFRWLDVVIPRNLRYARS